MPGKRSNERLEAASKRALELSACSYQSLKSILKRSLDRQAALPLQQERPGPRHENLRGSQWYGLVMRERQQALSRGRHFRSEIIVPCLRWYLRYPLSYRNLEEMMAERGLSVDHSTIARWLLHYAPILERRIRRVMHQANRSWRVDETYVRVAGKWAELYRAIDSAGDTIDFLRRRIGIWWRPKAFCGLR